MTDSQAREVSQMLVLIKFLVAAAFVLGGWQTYVTLTLNQHATQIAEVKATAAAASVDLGVRVQDYRNWRENVTTILTRQTAVIENQQAQMQSLAARVK